MTGQVVGEVESEGDVKLERFIWSSQAFGDAGWPGPLVRTLKRRVWRYRSGCTSPTVSDACGIKQCRLR